MTVVVSAAAELFEGERREFEERTPRSRERFRRALDVFPGGDTRVATNYKPYPATIGRADGIVLVDLDGNEYSDFLLNYTSLVLLRFADRAGDERPDQHPLAVKGGQHAR